MKGNNIEHNNNNNNVNEITIIRSIEEIERIRPIWEQLQWHPNTDIDFYLTIINNRPEVLRPHIILISVNGTHEGMLIGRVENQIFDIKIGYKKIFSFKIRTLRVIYGGIIGGDASVAANIFISELIKELKNYDLDAVFFNMLPVQSITYQLARTQSNIFRRYRTGSKRLHWKMFLPSTFDELLNKMRLDPRYQIKRLERYARSIQKDFHGKVEYKIRTTVDEIDIIAKHAELVMKKTFQRGLGVGFYDNASNRKRLCTVARKGDLRAYELCINERPIAFWIGTQYKGIFYLDFTGYDPDYKKYDPGMILFIKMLEDCCVNNIKEIDFGFGDAYYKNRFGDHNFEEEVIGIFSVSFKGILINTVSLIIDSISQLAKSILEKTSLLGRIKKKWRNNLANKAKQRKYIDTEKYE